MMGTFAYFSMLSLPYSIAGLAVTSKGILVLTACLRNMLIARVVPMPSSEKSFAVVVPRLPLHAYGDVDRPHAATSLPPVCTRYGDCTRGRRYVPGIRHGATDIRRVATWRYAAASWLAVNSPDGEMLVRFDIIDMLVVSADRALLKHHINAFSCGVEQPTFIPPPAGGPGAPRGHPEGLFALTDRFP